MTDLNFQNPDSYDPFATVPPGSRILLAFSGGVDSSVAAALALRAGFQVTAVRMTLLPGESAEANEKAAKAAEKMGIQLVSVDCSAEFEQRVLRPCWDTFKSGRTPNPCAVCNPTVKFGCLMPLMEQYGCAAFATGHYAKVFRGQDGTPVLARGSYREKDQSYFLFALRPEQLAKIVFPLGGLTKPHVRAIAYELGLPNAGAKESQDACFMPPDKTASEFLHDHFAESVPGGEFAAEPDGRVLGRHSGIYAYTIGQRKGTGVAMGVPAWVSRIDAAANRVWLSTDPADLLCSDLLLPSVQWLAAPPAPEFPAQVQIRYRSKPTDAGIAVLQDGAVRIHFDVPQRAVTPGQAAVLYDGDRLLGGGWIP